MSEHDRLLEEGPRIAPEPETAEVRHAKIRTRRGLALGAAGGLGVFKIFGYLIVWNALSTGFRHGWWGAAVIAVVVLALVIRHRLRSNR